MGFSSEELEGNNIFIAASDGRQDLVEYYLANGGSVTDQDDLGYSAFHAAASYNHTSLMQFLLSQPNANAALADHDGDTALHVTETVEMAHLLLAHETGGAALTAMRNSEGKLAIEAADEEGFVELVEFLKGLFQCFRCNVIEHQLFFIRVYPRLHVGKCKRAYHSTVHFGRRTNARSHGRRLARK
ncbi:ankyrin repeat-containing domain protein [Chytriomyces cf. hyalinus JEL632]|nr:ankyrin repeat-containing domain protein [Chytriomyces cf. hyalinus JEL632]